MREISHARHLGCEMAEGGEGGGRSVERNRRSSLRESQRSPPPPPRLTDVFATLFVNYLVIECEEAESHRLNYHSWRATGGLIVYRRSGDVGMRKEGDREIILRASPPCFPVSFVNCPLGQCVPIVFFFFHEGWCFAEDPGHSTIP